MNEQFNELCGRYYRLSQQLTRENAYLQKFLDNAPFYQGETQLSEIDYIIKYYLKTQTVKAAVDKTMDKLNKTVAGILYLMKFFDIPPGTRLHGIIEDEVEFEVWADETDQIHTVKTKDLTPPDNPNIITIRLGNAASTIFDDEDEWFLK
jgi:hypothetical protein